MKFQMRREMILPGLNTSSRLEFEHWSGSNFRRFTPLDDIYYIDGTITVVRSLIDRSVHISVRRQGQDEIRQETDNVRKK